MPNSSTRYVRGSRADYDAWAQLSGSDEWSWDGLLPYFKKHQTIDLPSDKVKAGDPKNMPHVDHEKSHGTGGPIHTSFNDHRMPLEDDFVKAAYEHGGKENTLKDAWSGDHSESGRPMCIDGARKACKCG